MILVTELQAKILAELAKNPGISAKEITKNIKGKDISIRVNLPKLQELKLASREGQKYYYRWKYTGLDYKPFNKRWLGNNRATNVSIEDIETIRSIKKLLELKKIEITDDMLPKWPVPPSVLARVQDRYPSYRG